MRGLFAIVLLLLALPAAAQEPGAPPGEGRFGESGGDRDGRRGPPREDDRARMMLESLEGLQQIRLEGEDTSLDGYAFPAELGALEGAAVVAVTAQNPIEGFDPALDSDVPLGISLDRRVLRNAVKSLWSTGNYRQVRLSVREAEGGAEILIHVIPMLRLTKVSVSGNKALSQDEIEQAIDYRPDGTVMPTVETIKEFEDNIKAAYRERGYRETKPTLRMEATDRPAKVALAIEVDEGEPDRYTRITIPGLPEELVGPRIIRKIGLRPHMVRDKAKVEKATELLVEVLAEHGYLDAMVSPYKDELTGEHSLALQIPVTPGIHTRIKYRGNRRLKVRELEEALAKLGSMRSSPTSLRQTVDRLRRIYVERGMLFARVEARRVCVDDDKRKTVRPIADLCPANAADQEVLFEVIEGPPVQVSAVSVEGNEYFSDEEISDEVLAHMLEKNASKDATQPLNTRTFDRSGSSEPQGRTPSARGAVTSTVPPARIYNPRRYQEVAEHLLSLYQEQGFLSATVSDTCNVRNAPARRLNGRRYRALETSRDAQDEEGGLAPCLFIDDDMGSLIVHFTVEEGPQTLLGELRVEGNDPDVFTEKALLDSAKLRAGQPYNEYNLETAIGEMRATYQERGYYYVEIAKKTDISPDGRIADTTFSVTQGPRVTIDRIIVRGNAKTRAYLITDRIRLEAGELLTPDRLKQAEQLLADLGIFEDVQVSVASPDEKDEKKSVIVRVTENKNNYVDFRLGIATVEGVRGQVEYGYRNIGGAAVSFRFRGRVNYRILFPGKELESFEERYRSMTIMEQLERHVLLGLDTPHVMGTGGLLGAGINITHERTNHPAFSADNWINGYLNVTSNYLRVLPVEARTGIEMTKIYLTDSADEINSNPRFTSWARMPEGLSFFWVTGLKVSLDLRDDFMNPRRRTVLDPHKGLFVSVSADLVRSLANFDPEPVTDEDGNPVIDEDTGEQQVIDRLSNLIRAKATVSGYVPLIGEDLVLALSGTLGYIFHLQEESTTWADRYFYMGGVGTLRGFFKDSLVPEDVYQDWKKQVADYSDEADALLDARGGESMFLLRAELKFPIAGDFRGGLFFEAGNVWRERTNLSFNPLNLRPTAGLGMRYNTPIGPIAFDMGFNLNKRPHEDWSAWFISIGSAF